MHSLNTNTEQHIPVSHLGIVTTGKQSIVPVKPTVHDRVRVHKSMKSERERGRARERGREREL